jgi:hypothetical protein
MIVVVPGLSPLTIPVLLPIVATDGTVLVHVPLPTPSVYNALYPWQTVLLPDIDVGALLTVTITVAEQPKAAV